MTGRDFNIRTRIQLVSSTQLRCIIMGLRVLVDHHTDDDVRLTRHEFNTSNQLRMNLESILQKLEEKESK